MYAIGTFHLRSLKRVIKMYVELANIAHLKTWIGNLVGHIVSQRPFCGSNGGDTVCRSDDPTLGLKIVKINSFARMTRS